MEKDNFSNEHNSIAGGLSGKPLFLKSNKVLEQLANEKKKNTLLIGTGGIFSAMDAYEKIKIGASAIQIYSGFIYQGPMLLEKIKKELVRLVRADGYKNLAEAIGTKSKVKRGD